MINVNIIEKKFNYANSLSERSYTDMIVIHHTGSVKDVDFSAEQIHNVHLNNSWSGIGYHFVIRKDGTIERGREEWAVGSHAYGENYHTLGIHLSGDFDAGYPTETQFKSCSLLIAYLAEKYEIPVDRNHIVGHGELMPTGCPGRNLSSQLDNIVLQANQLLNSEETENFSESTAIRGNSQIRYMNLDDIPDWGKSTIQKLIDKNLLNGNGEGLDLSVDMLRIFVINDRAGLY